MPTNLAPIYLDDARVQLQDDPRPKVSKIVAAGGKAVDEDVVIVRLREQDDDAGSPVRLEDVIDRATGTAPVYLRCLPSELSLRADEDRGVGSAERARPQRPKAQAFGAGRPGMAGQGAQGSEGTVPADKRAKSDFDPSEGLAATSPRESIGAPDAARGPQEREWTSPAWQGEGQRSKQRSREGDGAIQAQDSD